MINAIAMFSLLIVMLITLVRARLGPSVYDRILAINSCGTAIVLFIVVHGYLTHRPEFMDVALAYALINFIGTLAVLKFFQHRDLGHTKKQAEEAA